MSDRPGATRFNVAHQESSQDPQVPAGVMTLDEAQRITVVEAQPPFADLLGLAATMVNSSKKFAVRISPPGDREVEEEPAPLTKRMIPRDDPGAREAVLTVLERTYNLVLTPAD